MPPAPLAHLKRRASEKKRPEAWSWCEWRQLNKWYVLREKDKPDPAQPGRRSGRPYVYQLKSGHALLGVYLEWTKNRPDDHCWWCDPENGSGAHQTRDHLFRHCYKWKDQLAAMWAKVTEETKKGKQKWPVGDLLADDRCSPTVLDFLRSTHVGRTASPVEENWDSEGSEADLGEVGEDGAQEADADRAEEQAE